MKPEAPKCSRCGHSSSEDTFILYDCGGHYLCGDCYDENEIINGEIT